VLTQAAVFTNSTVVAGTINSGSDHGYIIDVYRNTSPDPSGHGQGQTYAGSTIVQTDSQGDASFSIPMSMRLTGQYLTATATDATTGDTSEFCLDLKATNSAGPGPGGTTVLSYSPANGFGFNIALTTNEYYTVQFTTNLASAWTDLTNFVATNSSARILDPAATNARERFYRVVTP
jgi:hypothetical protein